MIMNVLLLHILVLFSDHCLPVFREYNAKILECFHKNLVPHKFQSI